MSVKAFKTSFVHNCVRLRWVELYLAPGSWSGLLRTGAFHVPVCVEAQPDCLAFSWVQDPDSRCLHVSLLPLEPCQLHAALGLHFVMVAFFDSDFLLLVLSSHHPEMMEHCEARYLNDTACLWAWERRGVALVQAIDEWGDLWKFPQPWEFWCHPHSLSGLQLHDTRCVKRKRNLCERPSSTEPVGNGERVGWGGAWHFLATSIRKCPVMQMEAGWRAHCVSGAPMKTSCCVTDWYNMLQACFHDKLNFFFLFCWFVKWSA